MFTDQKMMTLTWRKSCGSFILRGLLASLNWSPAAGGAWLETPELVSSMRVETVETAKRSLTLTAPFFTEMMMMMMMKKFLWVSCFFYYHFMISMCGFSLSVACITGNVCRKWSLFHIKATELFNLSTLNNSKSLSITGKCCICYILFMVSRVVGVFKYVSSIIRNN